ncbi:MAG: polysaccharide pyruvyl transferase family protein, partial [Bacteroidales bacterium]|nr:polysaccharide pyruvyl transferase family protein [Bacteroidales bacterium]
MKIGILTYHSSKNFGSSLQCFALYSLIKQKKHKPVVIDYYSFNRKGIKNFIRRCIFFFEKLIKKSILNPQSQFLHFEYNLSKPYKTSDFILNEKLDKIVVGGDQLWNPAIIHNVYYGSFDTKNNYKKYSYAVSFGQSAVTLSNERIALLKNFTCLSVRENEGKNILDKYGLNSKVCLDPVLLHDSKFWKKNERKPYINDKRFIFCYFLKGIDSYSEDILEYSKRKNIKC